MWSSPVLLEEHFFVVFGLCCQFNKMLSLSTHTSVIRLPSCRTLIREVTIFQACGADYQKNYLSSLNVSVNTVNSFFALFSQLDEN
jgi:hypothetical protein